MISKLKTTKFIKSIILTTLTTNFMANNAILHATDPFFDDDLLSKGLTLIGPRKISKIVQDWEREPAKGLTLPVKSINKIKDQENKFYPNTIYSNFFKNLKKIR